MKIAILASGDGEKAIFLHDFFKEGNRIEVDCLLTDNPYAGITGKMRQEGVDVIELLPDLSWAEIAELLKGREVELLVADDFSGEIPTELKEAFGEKAIVYLSRKERAPIEVIEAAKRLISPAQPMVAAEQPSESEPAPQASGEEEQKGVRTSLNPVEQEWADALDVDMTPSESVNQTPNPVSPDPAQAPNPVPPSYETRQTVPPSPQQNMGQSYGQIPDREPMPDTYLIYSVIITILCCLIPGIIAIIYSASVSSKYYQGNIEGAKRASRNAQIWCIVSIIAGIVWASLYVPLTLFVS